MQRNVYEFISKKNNDPIVERRKCKVSGEDFAIYQSDVDLLKKISSRLDGRQYDLPLPTLAPKYRDQRRLMWRNDTKLYKTICTVTGKNIITFYHPDINYDIVETNTWYDQVDNTMLGQEFDFTKTFGEQFSTLLEKTKKQNTLSTGIMENSVFSHNVGDLKNSYMVFDSGMCEDTLYSVRACETKNVLDVWEVEFGNNIYESISINNSANIFYSQDSQDCSYGAFLYNCVGCHNCICCTNLVNKEYYVFNKQVTKQEYQDVWEKLFSGNRDQIDAMQMQYEKLKTQTIKKHANILNSDHCVGHNIVNCKNTLFSDEMDGVENFKYSSLILNYGGSADCMDISSRGGHMNNCYEQNCSGSDDHTTSYNNQIGSYIFWGVNNTQYSVNLPRNCDYLFGCTDLQGKKYCILNKQHTKEEYNKLVPKIIAHMQKTGERGEFFSPKYSPFPYNDTIANDYYPVAQVVDDQGTVLYQNDFGKGVVTLLEPQKTISKAILDLGGEQKWHITRRTKEQDITIPQGMETMLAQDLPGNIADIDDSILQKAIICIESKRPFRIVKKELDFYRKYDIPIPVLHPDVRYIHRIRKRVFMNLCIRKCDKCLVEIISVYHQGYQGRVYCQKCYDQEVY